ncbi:MAG: tellurite resistance protein TerC [Pseudonocardiales bacterium]|nr:tellurite resistance protein TerC [Pseudonocardiales bacterium]
MEVSPLVWGLTIAAIAGLLVFDFAFHVRKAHVPTLREAALRPSASESSARCLPNATRSSRSARSTTRRSGTNPP